MTLIIELPEYEAEILAAKARARGLSIEEYARELLEDDIAPKSLRDCWDAARRAGTDRMTMEEIDAEIAAARKARRESRSNPDR